MSPSQNKAPRSPRSTFWRRPEVVIGYLALLVLATVLRRPDAVSNPQFWAEDGHFWFADAYNDGPLASLVRPEVGYLQTISRLTGILALPFGLRVAPTLFNAVALALQILPAVLVLSARFERAIPSLRVRYLIGGMYIAIPNYEVHGNVTNAQWHLALLAIMVVVAAPSSLRRWRVFDLVTLLLAGLSGPFVFLLAPAAIIRWLVTRDRWHLPAAILTSGLAVVQGITALLTISGRSQAPLGAGLVPAARILADRVVVPGLLGEEDTAIYTQTISHGLLLAAPIAAIAAALIIASLVRGPWELKLLNGFAFLSLFLALLKPQVSLTLPQWPLIAGTSGGARYFLLPMVAWMVTVVWAVSTLRPRVRVLAGGTLAVVLCIGAGAHWRYVAYTDLHPAAEASRFEKAAPGSRVDIAINPPGWTMELTKR